MKLEKIALFSSITVITGLLVREALAGKVKFWTIAIKKSDLEAWVKENRFVTLHFNTAYDDEGIDSVMLGGYFEKKTAGGTVFEKLSAGMLQKGRTTKAFSKQRHFANFKLTVDDAKRIISHYTDPEPVYYLFKPDNFKGDSNYISYTIKPGDMNRREIQPDTQNVNILQMPMMSARSMNISTDTQETSFESERRGYLVMDPSPPASANLSLM